MSRKLAPPPTGEPDQGIEHQEAGHVQAVLFNRRGERLDRLVGAGKTKPGAGIRGESGGKGADGGDRRPLRAPLLRHLLVELPSRLVAGFCHVQNILAMSRQFPGRRLFAVLAGFAGPGRVGFPLSCPTPRRFRTGFRVRLRV